MTRWQSELVHRLRAKFWMSQSMYTDDVVLRKTKGTFNRALIEFRMNAECLWAAILGRYVPWMDE